MPVLASLPAGHYCPISFDRAGKDDARVVTELCSPPGALCGGGGRLCLHRSRAPIRTLRLLPSWRGWSSSQRRCSCSVFSMRSPLRKVQQVQEPVLPSSWVLCLERFASHVSASLSLRTGGERRTRAKSTPLSPSWWVSGRSHGRCHVPL